MARPDNAVGSGGELLYGFALAIQAIGVPALLTPDYRAAGSGAIAWSPDATNAEIE